jgi:uncharacterized iron-regulated protein
MTRSTTLLGAGTALGVALSVLVSACSGLDRTTRSVPGGEATGSPGMRVDAEDPASLGRLLDEIQDERVVLVGETHDRYDHHLNQLAVVRGLDERGVELAIGVEFFQTPFQRHLDDYVSGGIGEKELLKRTEWYERWRFDYRLYRDILDYAKRRGIPLVALNAPAEVVAQVSEGGIVALGEDERERLGLGPDDDTRALRERMGPIFAAHGPMDAQRLDRFVDVQRLWDASMARAAADYLEVNPSRHLVILAGSGHVVPPEAIPGRLARMGFPGGAVIATGGAGRFSDHEPRYLFADRDLALGPPGRLGVDLIRDEEGVRVHRIVEPDSGGDSGLREGDRILRIAGEPIRDLSDVRLAMLDRGQGEKVRLELARADPRSAPRRVSAVVRLL